MREKGINVHTECIAIPVNNIKVYKKFKTLRTKLSDYYYIIIRLYIRLYFIYYIIF